MEPRPTPNGTHLKLQRTSCLGVVIALVTLFVSLIIAPPKLAQGEGGRRGLQVFKGGGVDFSTLNRKSGPPPLTAFDVKTLAGMVGSEPGSVFAKLTPHEPSIGYKATLVFVEPKLVETGTYNYAAWGPSPTQVNTVGPFGSLMLWLKPGTGRRYLIDCAVASTSQNARFFVKGPPGTAPMDVDAIPGGQHLTFVLDATDNKWLSFQINGAVKPSTNSLGVPNWFAGPVEWTFYSCEITNL